MQGFSFSFETATHSGSCHIGQHRMTTFIPFDLVVLSLEFYPKEMTGRINKLAVRGSSVKGREKLEMLLFSSERGWVK